MPHMTCVHWVCFTLGFKMHSLLYCSELPYYTVEWCFPAKELHTVGILTLNVAFKSVQNAVSKLDAGKRTVQKQSYRTTIDAEHNRGDSLQTAVLIKDKCLPGVKFTFIAFLPRASLTVLSAVISGLFVFAVGWPQFSWFFLSWRERVHNSLKLPMGRFLIVRPSILLSDLFIFILDVHNLMAH